MIIKNRKDKVVIDLQEPSSTSKPTYTIKDLKTCLYVVSGILPTEGNIEHSLPDGKYELSVNGFAPQQFVIYYNTLDELIKKFKKIICECFNCKKDEEAHFKLYYDLMTFLNYTGFNCELCSMKFLSDDFNILKSKEEDKKYFGSFTFDYKERIITFITLVILELYSKEFNLYPTDSEEIDSMFSMSIIEKCLYKKGIDFNYLNTLSNNYICDCNCNETIPETPGDGQG